jgi:superfamily I DNA and/or RNA helicase
MLFERMIEKEFAAQAKRGDLRKIAHRLTEQHRMHPAIARVISKTFYGGDLKSHKTVEGKFLPANSPIEPLRNVSKPDAPIIIVDMPYLQSTVGLKGAEKPPRWHNPDEVKAVEQVLATLKVAKTASRKPRLAILSPYREQLRRLRRQIDENVSGFVHLDGFVPAVGPSSYCGTVDSFQGNQADVVIVSFVRNNHHSGARGALGFLSDPKRMNVLLSRARWRLVLVGSTDFLRAVLKSNPTESANAVDLGFLRLFLEALGEEQSNGNAVVVRPGDLPGLAQP